MSSRKRIVIVLGMHRSGTSAITRSLKLLGVDLGENLLPAGFANPKGFWEDNDVVNINDRILKALDSSYEYLGGEGFNFENNEVLSCLFSEAISLVGSKVEADNIWGVKDPRICRLLPFWQQIFEKLNIEDSYVVAVRNPVSVAESLARRDGLLNEKAYYLWLEHVIPSVLLTSEKRRVFVRYDAMLEAPAAELIRIAGALCLPQPLAEDMTEFEQQFLDASLRNSHYSTAELMGAVDLPDIVKKLYLLLMDLSSSCADDRLAQQKIVLDEIISEYAAIAPLLRLIGASDCTANKMGINFAARLAKAGSDIAARDSKLLEVDLSLQHSQKEIDAYKEQADVFFSRINELEALLSETSIKAQCSQDQLEEQCQDLTRLVFEKDSKLLEVDLSLQHSQKEIDAYKEQADVFFSRINELEALLSETSIKAQCSQDQLEEQCQDLTRLVFEKDSKLSAADLSLQHSQKEIDAYKEQADVLFSRVNDLEARLAESFVREQNSQANIQRLHQDLDQLAVSSKCRDDLLVDKGSKIIELLSVQVSHIKVIEDYNFALQESKKVSQVLSRALAQMFTSSQWKIVSALTRFRGGSRHLLSPLLKDSFGFDRDAYLAAHPDVSASKIAPEEHVLAFGLLEGRVSSLTVRDTHTAMLAPQSQVVIETTELIDATSQSNHVIQVNEVLRELARGDSDDLPDRSTPTCDISLEMQTSRSQDLAAMAVLIDLTLQSEQVIENGEFLCELAGRDCDDKLDSEFDAEFYLAMYPDLKVAGVDPAEHYQMHGRHEGRQGSLPALTLRGDIEALDPLRKTVLVVSHEASRTGAPILSLNLVELLSKKHNVVALLLGGGHIEDAFVNSGAIVVGPLAIRGNPNLAKLMLHKLLDRLSIDFALVNSIESRVVLQPLAARFVPTLSLIHEFAAYTRPRDAFREALFWSGDTIFSADLTLKSAQLEYPELSERASHILPQGRCLVPEDGLDAEAINVEVERILRVLRPGDAPQDSVVVLGAGFVQFRKGVDIFIECAARVVNAPGGERCRFVWIGQGYDPEWDSGYSVYLADQLRRAKLEKNVFFVAETSAIDAVYQQSDILLLTSRLDPLPNVAIDAMNYGVPVICFANTTGIADFLLSSGLEDECVASYLDTADMAEKVLALACSTNLRHRVGQCIQSKSREYFDMEKYVQRLEAIAATVLMRTRQEQLDLREIERSNLPCLDFVLAPYEHNLSREEALRGYVRAWASGIGLRKPFPGFHPGIYTEQHGLSGDGVDPFADFLRAGQPSGSWLRTVLSPASLAPAVLPDVRIALHLHVYYPDLLPEIMRRLSLNSIKPDLFVSVPSVKVESDVADVLKDYEGRLIRLEVVPNRGRDIGPFLTAFAPQLMAGYDIVGHLHTKKTVDVADAAMGERWYQFLLENLLGGDSGNMADLILGNMCADTGLGLVFPDDPHITSWSGNKEFALPVAARLGLTESLRENFHFPVGTMFWARTQAITSMMSLFPCWDDYPKEPLPYDGSLLHALERLIPFVCEKAGYEIALTHVPQISR